MKVCLTFTFILLLILPTEAQSVLVNQAGYLPEHEKFVYFTEPADSFFVINESSGAISYRGKVDISSLSDESTGLTIYSGDFSKFTQPGKYKIKTNNSEESYPFVISKDAFKDLYKKSLKAFYFQRCGIELTNKYAGIYSRKACHVNDAFLHPSTGVSGVIKVDGGWHDAGDFGKYIVNAGITVGTLLSAYELFPQNFSQDNLNIPESNNSIPDILDEVKYELEWFLKMQDTDGGVFFKVTPKNFSGFVMPSNDKSSRYIYQKSTTATADFAAVMAQASRIFSPFDTLFSHNCLTASQNAWSYLEANKSIVPSGGFRNPSDTNTGEYGDGSDSDERLWAAAELFKTTGSSDYNVYFMSHYNSGSINNAMSWQNVRTMALISYLTNGQKNASTDAKNLIQKSLDNYCSNIIKTSMYDGLRVALNTNEYYWGSNSIVMNKAVLLILNYKLSGKQSYYKTALDQLNYILGCNANDISYVTQIGSKYPMHPHHRVSASDGIAEPVPGLLAGGPDRGLDDAVLQSLYTNSTPPALCYVDNQGSYASNEIAINWNAPLVFVAGFFASDFSSTGIIENMNDVRPDKIQLKQNYPNPFNPSTTLEYYLPFASNVKLSVYNLLGQRVANLIDKYEKPGNYKIDFNAIDLSSGIYFYKIEASNGVQIKKMILLR